MVIGDHWRRFNHWARNLSRTSHTLLAMSVAFITAGTTSFLLSGDVQLGGMVGAAIGIGIVNYAMWSP